MAEKSVQCLKLATSNVNYKDDYSLDGWPTPATNASSGGYGAKYLK
jgi:hypothetical protein